MTLPDRDGELAPIGREGNGTRRLAGGTEIEDATLVPPGIPDPEGTIGAIAAPGQGSAIAGAPEKGLRLHRVAQRRGRPGRGNKPG